MIDSSRRLLITHLAAGVAIVAVPGQQSESGVLAQGPGTQKRGPALVTLVSAGAKESVGCCTPWQHGIVPVRGGSLFVLVVRSSYEDEERTRGIGSDLELWRSRDRGVSWQVVNSAPTTGDSDGALVPDGDHLAVAWTAHQGKSWASAFMQRYDVTKDAWLGEPVLLAGGTGPQDQYFVTDLERTRAGALVAAIGCHASPPGPAWTCAWSTGLTWLSPGAAAWTPVAQANVSSYGCCGNLAARGELVDVTYRTCPNEAIHGLRTLDLATGKYQQATEDCAMTGPHEGAFVANVGVLAVDGTGGRTLLHLLGDHAPGKGRLAVSFARPGSDWVSTDLADDPVLFAGNENPQHYTLARGPANQLYAYFSKASEQFANLWQCAVEDGKPVGAARIVVPAAPNTFVAMTGCRTPQAFSTAHVVVYGKPATAPGGIVSVYGTWPAQTAWPK